jgi:hypothetical protein
MDIPVVGSNLVEDAIWVGPLIEHGLGLILLSFKPEPNRAFIGVPAQHSTPNFISFILLECG